MLAALESLTGELNSAHQVGSLTHRHNACKARWVPQVTILPAPGFQPGANPSQLETRGRDTRTRTSSATSQAWCADPYAISRWKRSESNRLGNACKACPLPQLLAPIVGAAPGTGLSPGVAGLSFAAPHHFRGRMAPAADAHAMEMSKSKHVRPRAVLCRGGRTRTPDAQFWRLPFWPLNYAPMADPYKRRTARRKSPRAVPGDLNSALPGNLREAQGKRRARLAVPVARFIRLPEHRHE